MSGGRLQPDLDALFGLDLFTGLFRVFLALRLSGAIDWSRVFAPLSVRLPAVLWMLWLPGVFAAAGTLELVGSVFRRRS